MLCGGTEKQKLETTTETTETTETNESDYNINVQIVASGSNIILVPKLVISSNTTIKDLKAKIWSYWSTMKKRVPFHWFDLENKEDELLSNDQTLETNQTSSSPLLRILTCIVGSDKRLVRKYNWPARQIEWNNDEQNKIIELRDLRPCKQIPTEIGSCLQLQNFYCSNNQLTGYIPTEFGLCFNLQHFYCSDNQLSGQIPTEFGSCLKLQDFYCYNNQLTGQIPTKFGSCVNLQHFNCANNQLTGPIPTEFGQLQQLHEFYCDRNSTTGQVPTEFGLCSTTSIFLLFG